MGRGKMIPLLLISAIIYSTANAQEIKPAGTYKLKPYTHVTIAAPSLAKAAPNKKHHIKLHGPLSDTEYKNKKETAVFQPENQATDLVTAPSGPAPMASTIATTFTGLDRPSATNNGYVFFPPDTIVSKSYTKVVEGTNSALRLFDTTGSALATKDLNTFFAAPTANGLLFDPKVYFDRNAANKRFYVTALQRNMTSSPKVSRIWLAVSRSSDPANLDPLNWCFYNFEGRRNIGTVNESWADYPGLGAGADSIIISANQFRYSDSSFTYAIVHAIRKGIASNALSCPTTKRFTFQPSAVIGDGATFTLQPVQHYTSPTSYTGTTKPAYLLSTTYGSSNQYSVFQVRNVASTSPSLRRVNVTGAFTYNVQADAPQLGTATLLATGDNRMTQAGGAGNALHGVHATFCNIAGGATESCIRYVRIIPGQDLLGNLTAAIGSQRTFGGGAGQFFFWPGIAVNNRNQVAIDFHKSSAATYLSSMYTMKDNASTIFEAAMPITTGTCSQTVSDRTGDYIGAQTDPADLFSFWFAGERATTIGGTCVWETQILKMTPGTDIVNLTP